MQHRRNSVATLLIVCLAGAGCGGDSGNPTNETPTVPSTSASILSTSSPTGQAIPTAATLKSALLTVQDFPTGWKTTPVSDSESEASGDCGDRLEAFDDAHPDSKIKAEAAFESDSDEIDEELMAFTDIDALTADVAEYISIIRGCTTIELQVGDDEVKLSVSELSFPRLGDESLAYSATGKIDGVSIELNLVMVRLGPVLLQLTQSGVFSADAEFLSEIATKAVAKLEAAIPIR